MSDEIKEIANNKKARFNYEILETFEAGLALKGTEVKSIRLGKCSINEAYAYIKQGEVYLIGMNITPYEFGNRFNHLPVRDRKLLLHKKEIDKLIGKLQDQGFALVPLKLYFKNGKVKVLLGLAKGKHNYDKRQTIKERDAKREIDRALKRY